MAVIIGIGGASQSGKSTLASGLKDQLSNRKVLLLEMDEYVFPKAVIPKIKGITDWERPESVNYNRLIATIKNSQGDYDVIIAEGILAFANEALNELYDLTVLMNVDQATFLERRSKETRWGTEPEWYPDHVWKSWLRYGQYPEADLVLSGEKEISLQTLKDIIQRSGL